MPHLSELHGAATHLAVVAIPVYAIVLMLRRFGPDHEALVAAEPWLLGAAVLGVLAAGVTGLLVWGQAQTSLRGSSFRIGTLHFWLGIALAVVLIGVGLVRAWSVRGGLPTHRPVLLSAGVLALVVVFVQGYLGGRMTYQHGVGIESGGQLAQTASGAKRLEVELARGRSDVSAGKAAFSASGLGCVRCHGDLAQGARAPRLAGGLRLDDFRRVHGHGLFPRSMVSDRDVRAIDAWLRKFPKKPPPID
jgi:uncharacterized membrane protein